MEHPVLLHVLAPHIHGIHEKTRRIQGVEPLLRCIRRMRRLAFERKVSVVGSFDLEFSAVLVAQMDHRRILITIKATIVRHDTFAAPEFLSRCADQIDPYRQIGISGGQLVHGVGGHGAAGD